MAVCFSFRLAILLLTLMISLAGSDDVEFIYNGFRSANLTLDGIAQLTSTGLLKLTNETKRSTGQAFYPHHTNFKNSTNGSVSSFSTTFVFAILSKCHGLSSDGMAFVISPSRDFSGAGGSQYFGLFNKSSNGKATNHIVAVEVDTVQCTDLNDIDENHVGIDINGLISEKAFPAGYYEDGNGKRQFRNLNLISGQRLQVWVEYDGVGKRMDVTLAPFKVSKPKTPLLSLHHDLSSIVNNEMYVGFSSSTDIILSSHYVLGWSFKMNGQAKDLTLSQLPKLPKPKKISRLFTIELPSILVTVILVAVSGVVYYTRRKRKFAKVVEDWELEYGPHRFRFKDLYFATKGFKDEELLGAGGFGRVYKGTLPTSKLEVAVKRVSHESRQRMKEFVAEIVSIGRLRHRNLVQLLGYCRRKGELLLVYDYMPNGSLDKYLYNQPKLTLNWSQRDVKASNVLLDSELNGRLGDFGLARLCDHGTEPHTTHVVGTIGYLAPEHTRTCKATPCTDVFAFGAFLFEVACGRRPISQSPVDEVILVDWVYSCWREGDIVEAKDQNLGSNYELEEVELVLKLGLICSHSEPEARPTMRHVQFLERDMALPEISSFSLSSSGLAFAHREGLHEFAKSMSYTSSFSKGFSHSSSVAPSVLSGGRRL
ncbi:L-type lectin-domain containing receptor kinase IV.1-like [Gossypium australe]|uniref:non-specific serine/threonine protein kinase n=1 Tax=Gossypium australe TaxID=47621 RepID=A0A5B6UWS5_9ROSI|nr:L-type lectin-domain containing receptor kinase IV.1-like [Gossypium australe]